MRFNTGQTRRKLPVLTSRLGGAILKLADGWNVALMQVPLSELAEIATKLEGKDVATAYFAYDACNNEMVIAPTPRTRIDIVVEVIMLKRI